MWTRIIEQLIASGLTETEIAKEVGVEQPTINRLKLGVQKSTAYATGQKIMALHASRTSKGGPGKARKAS